MGKNVKELSDFNYFGVESVPFTELVIDMNWVTCTVG